MIMKQYPQKFFAWIALFLLFTAGTDFAHAASISKVETGNVTPSSFTVFWQATKNADPNIKIYSDFTGTDELNGRIRIEYFPLSTGDLTLETSHTDRTERRSLQNALKENGLFLARISNLNPNTRYYLAVEAAAAGETARFPQEDLLEVKTSHQTAFIRESLQIAIEFPGDNNGLVASLSTPDAANPLFATVGDSGFSNKAFFNLSDFIDPTTGTNLEPTNNLPLTVHLYLPDAPAESDEDQQVEFEQSFVVAKTIDLFFTGTGAPRVVRSFAFDLIGTQTADIPFKITLRALDSMGNPMSDFNDSAQLSASGAEVRSEE